MVLFPEPSLCLTPLLESGNFQVVCLTCPSYGGGRKGNENVFPASLLSYALPYRSHVRKSIASHPGWKGYTMLVRSSLQKWPHCTSVETTFIISVNLNWINSAYVGRQCQVHTQGFQQKTCTAHSIVISFLPSENMIYGNYLQPLPGALASSKVSLESAVKCFGGRLSWGEAAQLSWGRTRTLSSVLLLSWWTWSAGRCQG